MTALQGFFQKGFEIKAVTTNKRAVNVAPTIRLNSTKGKFTLSGQVTKVMGVKSGDFVTIASNEDGIRSYWDSEEGRIELENFLKSDESVNLLGESFDSIDDPRFIAAFEKAFIVYYVAKGYALFNADGTPVITVDRATKKDIAKHAGSRCASKGDTEGYGNQVDFQDTNTWAVLKADLVIDGTAESTVREYHVDIENPISMNVFDGIKEVKATFYQIKLDTVSDKTVQDRTKAEAKVEVANTESDSLNEAPVINDEELNEAGE